MAQTNEITIGITVTTTGPAAALGIPERNALDFVAKEIAGVPLKVIVLDDGGDPTAATTNARRFVTESKADIIMGSSTTPPTNAVSDVANEAGIPHIALAPFAITPARAKWSVAMPQPVPIMGKVLYAHMKAHNIKTVGYIGYSDSYGDLWANDFKNQAVPMGMQLVTEERFARPDTSVTGQVLKLLAANPDAVLVGASGTAAALPQTTLRERGYKGLIYQTHGAASMDFIRIAGPAAEGVLMASARRLQLHRQGPLRRRRTLPHPAHGEGWKVHAGEVGGRTAPERDDFSSNRDLAPASCLSMTFSENRCTLFRVMLRKQKSRRDPLAPALAISGGR